MSAVVGVLNESLSESIKGFYKLRKAYVTLDGILEAENKFMRGRGKSLDITRKNSFNSLRSIHSTRSLRASPRNTAEPTARKEASHAALIGHASDGPTPDRNGKLQDSSDGSDSGEENEKFFDADETHGGAFTTTTYTGKVELYDTAEKLDRMSIGTANTNSHTPTPERFTPSVRKGEHMLNEDPESEIFSNPIDVFIHCGSNLCFGLLLIIISMIPPAFSKLLFIIGFRGDRERGVRMLWQASKFHNINGAMAGLIVLGYYNTLLGFADIVPDPSFSEDPDNVDGYPKKRCEVLLSDMRSRYPKSHLWLLEEARMEASNRRLDKALELLSSDTKSPLKQVEALDMFEKGLNAMYSHKYSLCADSFVKCVSLNNWSHALYYYVAGAAHVQLYRVSKSSLSTTASSTAAYHAQKATDLLQLVPLHAGKKKFMARQLPFDAFVTRKLAKWEARAKEWSVPLIDAIGVSPIEEMIYFWNGYRRMNNAQLEDSLAALSWSEDTQMNPTWTYESLDEKAILSVLRAATLRHLGRYEEAKRILISEVVAHDRTEFKGHLRDDWTCPTAHYEVGVNLWMQRGEKGMADSGELEKERVRECKEWVEKAAKWESYDLDARIGLKITTAMDTLRKWEEGKSGGG